MKKINMDKKLIIWIKDLRREDVALVGGKNSSMGEMYSQLSAKGVPIPNAFALTSDSFWYFLAHNKIDEHLKKTFANFDAKNIPLLQKTSKELMAKVRWGRFPDDLKQQILENYKILCQEYSLKNADVAVRSSATAEDLPNASFAGQHETMLNISGESQLLNAVKDCMASLFTARAIAYRDEKGFDQLSVAISVLVQKMVRSDLASSGVMFSLDTESGFRDVVVINGIYGIGEMIVKGRITPDTFIVHKPTFKKGFKSLIVKNLGRKDQKYVYAGNNGIKEVSVPEKEWKQFCLTQDEALKLAEWAMIIEEHYKLPMDMEWAKDGQTGKLFIVQARPETVHAQEEVGRYFVEYKTKPQGFKEVVQGIAVGNKIGQGKVHIIQDVAKIAEFKKGEVLVTKMTDPDWVPIMRIAGAIVTDEGGTTSHAAIVSRELGVPCIVGTKDGSKKLASGQEVTVDCSQGRTGRVYEGQVPFDMQRYDLKEIPELPVKIAMNIGTPDGAFKYSYLPVEGVGLAREEFIIAEKIKAHPMALVEYDKISDIEIKRKIDELTAGYPSKTQYFVDELAEGVSQIAAAFYPREVIVRFSDFKTNEYESLLGGKLFEPKEENPMIGWRGASRYYDPRFKEAFKLECLAMKKVREDYGLDNLHVMIPFCRTPEEALKVMEVMKEADLARGKNGLKVYIMCEIPSNVMLADEFLAICDGFSIGSNDLTQCSLGLDRDNGGLAIIGNETNPAVKKLIKMAVDKCVANNKYVGICGDAPSTIPGFADFLIEVGIKSISLSPDAVVKTLYALAQSQKQKQTK